MFWAPEVSERPDDAVGSRSRWAAVTIWAGDAGTPRLHLQASHGCSALTAGRGPAGPLPKVPSRWGFASAPACKESQELRELRVGLRIRSSVQPERLEQLKASCPQMEAEERALPSAAGSLLPLELFTCLAPNPDPQQVTFDGRLSLIILVKPDTADVEPKSSRTQIH